MQNIIKFYDNFKNIQTSLNIPNIIIDRKSHPLFIFSLISLNINKVIKLGFFKYKNDLTNNKIYNIDLLYEYIFGKNIPNNLDYIISKFNINKIGQIIETFNFKKFCHLIISYLELLKKHNMSNYLKEYELLNIKLKEFKTDKEIIKIK